MGDQIAGRPRSFHHFHPWLKRRAGWLREADVHIVTGSGSWTLRPIERSSPASGADFAALRIPTDRRRGRWKGDYWVFYRAEEPLAAGGAIVSWGYESNTRRTRLLDTTPGSLPPPPLSRPTTGRTPC